MTDRLMDLTKEEHIARAMLAGYEHVVGSTLLPGYVFATLYRKKVGPGKFAGTALYSYVYADTLEPVPNMQARSELEEDWAMTK